MKRIYARIAVLGVLSALGLAWATAGFYASDTTNLLAFWISWNAVQALAGLTVGIAAAIRLGMEAAKVPWIKH